MLFFSLGIGALLFVLGFLTYWLAPRVGPNPIFGVRVGYSSASREVWDQTNRAGGVLIALIGAALAVAGPVLEWLGVPAREGIGLLTVGMILALLAAVVWSFLFARRLALGTALAKQVKPVPFRWRYLIPAGATFALLLLVAAFFYPNLGPGRIATHFNLSDQPDGYMSRDGFYLTFLSIAGLFVVLNALVVWAAGREPLIAFERLGSSWWMDPERGVWYTGLAFGLVNLIFAVAMADIGWFNTRGVHLFSLSLFLWMVVPIVAVLVVAFFLIGRRGRIA